MAISTNGLQLARIAGAVFNQQLSASDYSEILAANKTAAELDAWANAAVAAEFRNKTTTDIAKAVLANVGLSSVAGLEAWVAGQLTAGGGVAKAGATMLAMLNDFSNMTADATYGAAATTFNQKAANSQALSQAAGTAGGTYANVSTAVPSTPVTLTTGVDLKTTGAGADTFTSVNPTAATTTLTAGDNLNGGAGSDTLAITSAAEMTLGAGVTTTDIENVTVSASGGTLTLDTALMTGIASVANNGSTAAVSVTGLKALVPVSVTATSANTTVGFASAVTAGTADAITVNINGVGTSVIRADGFETINVASSGSASGGSSSSVNGTTVASTTLNTLNVTGTAAAKLVANLAGASAAVTGTVTSDDSGHDVDVTGRALTDKLSITMAGGNDTVRVDTVAATHTIAGGDGTDTLRYSGAAAVPLASTANITGIETVTLTNSTPASFAMTGAGVTTVNYTTAAAGTFGGLSNGGTIGLNLGGSMTAAAAGAAATATAAATLTAATYSGTADSLTVNVGLATHTTNPGATASTVSAVGVESVTFNSLAGSGVTEARTVTFADTTATTAALKSITVTGSIPALTTVAVSNTGTSALTTVNLSGVTGGASFTGGATAGTSITGGVGNDVLTGGAGPDNIIGGEGNDTINGAAGADTIDAGNGANNITGGAGADTMTGGTGVDTYVFAPNATTAATVVLTSTTSAPDTITNFTSGTDKISITGAYAPTKFLGNFVNIQAALSYQAGANGLAYGAAYVTGENTLYVLKKTDGLLDADDLAIKLTAVTAMVEADLFLGAQTTGGAAISLTAASAVAGQTGATSGTSVGGVASTTANLTTADDTVTTTAAFLEGSTLTAGFGNDTLALSITSTAANGAGEATLTATELANVTGFNTLTLANFTNSATVENVYNITVANANVDDNSTLTITSSMAGLKSDGTLSTAGVTFDAGNLTSNRKISFSGNSAHDVVTGGAGNDTITGGEGNDTIAGGTGTNNIDGGGGNDTINITNGIASTTAQTIAGGSGVADTLGINVTYDASNATTVASTSVNLTGSTISGFETILGDGNANRIVLTASQVNATGLTGITGGGGTDVLSLTGLGTAGATTATFDLTGKTLTTLETITLTSTAGAGETAPSLLVPSAQFTSGTITGTGGALTLTGTTAVAGTSFSGFATVNLSNVLTVASTQFQASASTDLTTITGTASTAGLVIYRSNAEVGTVDLSGAGKAALTGLATVTLNSFDAQTTPSALNNVTIKVDSADLQGTVTLDTPRNAQGNSTGGTGHNLVFASGDVTVAGLTIGNSFDTIQFGVGTGTGTQTLTLTNTALSSNIANVLGTNSGATEALVVNAATATAAIDVSKITATTDLASITVNDGTGNNTITTLSGAAAAARTAGKVTINLTGGGADTLALNYTTSTDAQTTPAAETSSNAGVIVNGFTTGIGIGSDKVTLTYTNGQTGITNFQSIGSGTSNTAAAIGAYTNLTEIGSAIGTVTDFTAVGAAGAVETTIAAALTGGTGATAANATFLIYGSGASAGKAALYQALIANVATDGNIGTGDISLVNLIGVFNDVTADSFVIGNFI